MKCPNCEFIDKDEAFGDPATCPKCGAIYEKALKVRELKDKITTKKAAKDDRRVAWASRKVRFWKRVRAILERRKERKERCAKTRPQALYTKDGAQIEIRVIKSGGGCLRPLLMFFAVVFAIALARESYESYRGYTARSGSPEAEVEHARVSTEREIKAAASRARAEVQWLAKKGIKQVLHDPYTAKFRNQRGACGEVNSKNLFGAYTGYKRFIYAGPGMEIIRGGPNITDEQFEQAWMQICPDK